MEDNETDVIVITEILQSCDFGTSLTVVRDGEEALALLAGIDADPTLRCPDLILLDLNIPKVSGADVLRQFRLQSRCRNCRVIIVTSSTSERDVQAVAPLAVDAYFNKPADLKAYMGLADVIHQVMPPRTN